MSKCTFLLSCGGVNALLHDATPMFVTCNLHTLFDHGVIEELVSGLLPALQNLLNNMIAVNIFTHFLNSVHKVALDQNKMIVNFCNFYKFLDRSGSVSVFAQCNWLVTHLLNDFGELFVITIVC